MTSLTRYNLRGTWAPVLLPINRDDTIDWSRLAAEVDALVGSGVDGVYTNGSSGEFYNQTENEFDRLSELVAEKATAARVPFQIGANHMDPRICRSRVERAAQLEPGAIQYTLPEWESIDIATAQRFTCDLADVADPIPLVLYNPPHAKRQLSPSELGRLAHLEPRLVGLKVVDQGPEWFLELNSIADPPAIFVPGHRLATGYRYGAAGSYSNIAALHPAAAKGWDLQCRVDLRAGVETEAQLQRFLQTNIEPLQRDGYSNAALDKTLAYIGGWADIGTRVRWPYCGVPEGQADKLRTVADVSLKSFFDAIH